MGKNSRLKKARKAARVSEQATEKLPAIPQVLNSPRLDSHSEAYADINTFQLTIHILLIFGLCLITGIFPIEAEDIFSNIVTGQLLWEQGTIPNYDPFSFTGPHPWLLNRPLASLIFYGIHSIGGLPAIQLFCAALFGLTYSILYLVWSLRSHMPLVTFTVVALAISASCYWFQTRIYVFAHLFTVISLFLMTSKRTQWMLCAIPLQIFWINSHPSAILGTGLAIYWWLITTLRERRFGRFSTLVLLGVLLANVASPIGFASYTKFADELFGSHPSRSNIFEWFSPFHPSISGQHLAKWFYAALAVFLFVLIANFLSVCRSSTIRVLLPITLLLAVMSIGSARHIPLFYFSLTGVLICTAESLCITSQSKLVSTIIRRQGLLSIIIPITALGVMTKVFVYGYANGDVERQFAFGIDKRKFPEAPITLLSNAQVGGNIFSEYGSGSYFLYRMYPRYKVYIDSARLDEVYGEDWFSHYMRFGNDVQTIKTDITKYDIRSFILPLPASEADIVEVYRFLSTSPDWRLAYMDDGHLVFVTASEAALRRIPAYRKLNPFIQVEKLIKESPSVVSDLEHDFKLGSEINPDSIAFLTLKAYFLKSQNRIVELKTTLDSLASVCPKQNPSKACRAMAARQLLRFGRFHQAKLLDPTAVR